MDQMPNDINLSRGWERGRVKSQKHVDCESNQHSSFLDTPAASARVQNCDRLSFFFFIIIRRRIRSGRSVRTNFMYFVIVVVECLYLRMVNKKKIVQMVGMRKQAHDKHHLDTCDGLEHAVEFDFFCRVLRHMHLKWYLFSRQTNIMFCTANKRNFQEI